MDLPYFTNVNPTAEHIAVVIYRIIRPLLDDKFSVMVRLYETERNFVEYPV
jgi:6-pyruvoyltetrahydropterin/6-carboxytetrahydropterin synthase